MNYNNKKNWLISHSFWSKSSIAAPIIGSDEFELVHVTQQVQCWLIGKTIEKLGLFNLKEYGTSLEPFTLDILFETLFEHLEKAGPLCAEPIDHAPKVFILWKHGRYLQSLFISRSCQTWNSHALLLESHPFDSLFDSLEFIILKTLGLIFVILLGVHFDAS